MTDFKRLIIFLGLFIIHASYATLLDNRRQKQIIAHLLHAGLNSNNSLQLPMPLHSKIADYDDGGKLCAYNFITKHLNYNRLRIKDSNNICGYNHDRCKVECDSHGNVIVIEVSV